MKTINKENIKETYTNRINDAVKNINPYVKEKLGWLHMHIDFELGITGWVFDVEIMDTSNRPFFVKEKEYEAIMKAFKKDKPICPIVFEVLEKWHKKEFDYDLKLGIESFTKYLKESMQTHLEDVEGSGKNHGINPDNIDYTSFLLGLYDDVIIAYNKERKSKRLKEISKENEILKTVFVQYFEDNMDDIASMIIGDYALSEI